MSGRCVNPTRIESRYEQLAGGDPETEEPAKYRGIHSFLCYRVEVHFETDPERNVLVTERRGFNDDVEVRTVEREWPLDDSSVRVEATGEFIADFARNRFHESPGQQLVDFAIGPAPDTSIRVEPGQAERLNALKSTRSDSYKDVLDRLLWMVESLDEEPAMMMDDALTHLPTDGLSEETESIFTDSERRNDGAEVTR